MNTHGVGIETLQLALGITDPWVIEGVDFNAEKKRFDIYLNFQKGTKFTCPSCGTHHCNIHDTRDKEWRHLDIFQYPTYLHVRVPRIECGQCKGIIQVNVPWAREYSSFTLLFEGMVVLMAQDMQVSHVAKRVNENDTRIWRIIKHYIKKALQKLDFSNITTFCVDETSERKGHKYITIFANKVTGYVLYVCKGKDASTVGNFFTELLSHHGNPSKITQACCDMSPAFISGITEYFVNAHIIFDKFHVMQLVNKTVDEVRRIDQVKNVLLKKTRYIWLKNPENLTEKQTELLASLRTMELKTARAYQMKLNLQHFWSIPDRETAEVYLKKWYFWLTHSKLDPMINVAKTIKKHWDGIMNYIDFKITNGLMEGLNSIVQTLKRSARGYRNTDNFILMIYLRCSHLKFDLPT
jgi:transposase